MNIQKSLLAMLAFLATLFTSCGTLDYYSLPEGYSGSKATIKDTYRKASWTKAEVFQVREINGQLDNSTPMATPYGAGPLVTSKESKREVPAGSPITLLIRGGDSYAADGAALLSSMSGNRRKSVEGEVRLSPKANRVYVVNGKLGKKSSSVWIEEEGTGRIVTERVSGSD